MDDFNMNNKTPLNSSDQNNEQPAAETRNTAPQNEQPCTGSAERAADAAAAGGAARTGTAERAADAAAAGGTACTGTAE